MPDTAAATLLKSPALKRLLAKPNKAPAPPIACFGVMESCFVSWPTSAGLGFLAVFVLELCACAGSAVTAKRTIRQAAAHINGNRFIAACMLSLHSLP
jgi:hypothetical protein